MSAVTLLDVRNLLVTRGGSRVLQVDDFSLKENETVALIGPNGAGKSSFLLSLARLLDADSGQILYRGEPVPTGGAVVTYRRKLAMAFQEPLLFDTTVSGNIAAGLKLRSLPAAEIRSRVDEYLSRFRISHLADRAARKLSGGEAQRTSLARAFATQPELALLDEPFAALDPPTRLALIDDLEKAISATGISVIITTHNCDDALRLADRIAVMESGRILQCASPESVLSRPCSPFVEIFGGRHYARPEAAD